MPGKLPVGNFRERVGCPGSTECPLCRGERARCYTGRGRVVGGFPRGQGEGGLGAGTGLEGGLDEVVLRPDLDLGEGDALGHGRDGRLLLADLLAETADFSLASLPALKV